MAEKKRKRNEEGVERPSKKAAVTPQGNVKVELLQEEALGPLLAATPGLKLPSRVSLKPYQQNKIHSKSSVTSLLLQSSDHARLDYTAEQEFDGSAGSQLKDYVGVFDPETKKLQLVPVKRVTVRSTLRSETQELQEEQARLEAAQGTMTAKRHALAAEFGSKKSRKRIDDITMNSIRSTAPEAEQRNEGVADNVLANMAGNTSAMPTKAELEAALDSSKPRPTPNLTAEFPGDVYTIDTVVGSELMGLIPIKDWSDASEAGQGVQVNSKYVAKRILKLCRNKQVQKLKVLRFILLCINFNAALGGNAGRFARRIPPKGKLETLMNEDNIPLVNAIRRKFGSENNDMPRWNIDNLMTHVAAAALIVDDFEVDVNDLREDLKIENKEIKQYFHELGCRVGPPTQTDMTKFKLTKAEAANHNVAKLRLPLTFPRVNIPTKKKR
ncbi:DNA-directed RNA polymerase I subunit rpa49 [Curvularia kusanoi]|uniref:DNA-directed RNA polymerase I subunit rpa49 n=1 Tax=Curvularia kusanoi TaxID=90978 RepID=A0A9P4TA39_CURKU|nr:DNA-directed RNA polymerase I subunit rpa49 [Curvularia kusanoi]